MTPTDTSALRALLAEHEVGVTYSSDYPGHAALVAIMNAAPDLLDELDQLREALFDIQERIEHTVNTKTQDGVGYVIDHWRGQDFVDGRDSGIEMIAGQVSSIIQALAIPAGPKAGE